MTAPLRDEPQADLFFRARTTQLQFAALAHRCARGRLREELQALRYYSALEVGRGADRLAVQRWLRNGWNTEMLLRQNRRTLDGDGLRNSLQWAFPQAYYAVYTVTCAYFAAVGFTEASHAGVITKYGKQVRDGCYPTTLCMTAGGGLARAYSGLGQCDLESPLHLDADSADNIDTHIRRFLNATREDDLRQRRVGMRGTFRTARGRPRQNLRAEDWEVVSARLGPTSVLSFLYRKRIKANYRDIETFLCPDLDAAALYEDLIFVVQCLNVVHEAYVARAMGRACLSEVADGLIPKGHRFLLKRMDAIASLEA